MELRDGTILQDGLRYTARKQNPGDAVRKIAYPVIGQIYNVVAADEDLNFDRETYLCDIHITELGIDLLQVPWTLDKAGPDNYVHYGPVAASKNLDFSIFNKQVLDPAVSNGDTVIVVFAFGDVHRPYIIKVLPHNQSGPDGMSPDPRPTSADGDCFKVRFNGTNFFIDKDGNVTFETTKTLDPTISQSKIFNINWENAAGEAHVITLDMTPGSQTIAVEHASGSLVHLDPDGSIDMVSSGGDEVLISPTDGIQLSTPSAGGTSASFKNGQVDIAGAQGVSLKSSGGDIMVESDGGDVTIKATDGDVNLEAVTGAINFISDASSIKFVASGGAELNLASGKVALGAGPNEVVDLLLQFVQALATATAPGFGAPLSSDPTVAALIPKITAIKGSL